MRTPSLIETIRIRGGEAPLWYLHLRRLASSCRALGIPLPRELPTPSGGPDRVHRLEVGSSGVRVSERQLGETRPVRLAIARVEHRPYSHKTTDRAQFDQALAEARAAGADDAVLLAPGRGYVAEAAIWSLCWWEGERLCAPPLDLGILPGVGRARLEELVGLEELRVTVESILERPLLVVNAARGVVPVTSLAGKSLPQDPRTSDLANRFWA